MEMTFEKEKRRLIEQIKRANEKQRELYERQLRETYLAKGIDKYINRGTEITEEDIGL